MLQQLISKVENERLDPQDAWRHAVGMLRKEADFAIHQEAARRIFTSRNNASRGPPALWYPSAEVVASTNLSTFIRDLQARCILKAQSSGDASQDYNTLYALSTTEPEIYWGAVVEALCIQFDRPPSSLLCQALKPRARILLEHPHPDHCRWLPGALLNIAASALTSPKAPSPSYPAIVWAAEGSPTRLHRVSLEALRSRAAHISACLRTFCSPGDAVALVLPMTAEAVAVYLGVVLAGCAVVSIADSFSPQEIATRLRIAATKAVITQDVVLRAGKMHPLLQKVLQAHPPRCVVLQGVPGKASQEGLRPEDLTWQAFTALAPATCPFQAHSAPADHITNILFSSGTTGEPKAIPWTQVTPLKCAADGWAHQDLAPGRVAAWPTSLGWMMGPWLLYACLLNGATIALYQGSPLGRDFGEFVQAAGVEMLGVVPSIVKAWRHSSCMKGLDWTRIRCFSSTGEASAPEDYHWLMALAGYAPVIEYCGGTELGGAYASGTLLQPQAPSTFSTPTLGTSLYLLAADGTISSHAEGQALTGEVALGGLLFGGSQQLLNRDHGEVYFSGMPQDPRAPPGRPLRRHGDELQRWEGGRYSALGRCDDTMNLGGIKVGSVEIERAVVEGVDAVAEAAAVGIPTVGGGPEQLHLFVVLRRPSASSARAEASAVAGSSLLQACRTEVRRKLNPLFKVEEVVVVEALPRTATNKVMRRVLRDQALGAKRPPVSKL